MTKDRLLLDACVAINLAATEHFEQIVNGLPFRIAMVRQAVNEVQAIESLVGSFDQSSAFEILDLTPTELPKFVELACDIDDGEAATIALARSRSIQIATDDRKARRVAKNIGLPEPLESTTLLRQYAVSANLNPQQVGEMLRKVRDKASYVPRHSDLNIDWWKEHIPCE